MDPYDFPSKTFISKKCIKSWGKPIFRELFLDELSAHESELPLDAMCESRGYPSPDDWATLSDLNLTSKTPPHIEGNFAVDFKAYASGGCRDCPIPFPVHGKLYFRLDLRNGEVTIDPPQDYSDWGH